MVLRTEDNRALESGKTVVQGGNSFKVQVSGGFVQEQAVGVAEHHLAKHAAHLFTTGKNVGALEGFFAGEEHAAEESANEGFVLFLAVLAQPIHQGEVTAEVSVVVLGEVAVANGVAPLEHAFVGLGFFGDELEEGRFEGVVFANQGDLVAAIEAEVQTLADNAVAAIDGSVLDFQHNLTRFAVHLEVDPGELTAGGRHFFHGHLVKELLTAGGLLGLGGVRSEAADKGLEFFNLFFGASVLILALFLGELASCIPEFVVTTVDVNLAVVDIASVGADRIEEVTVVAHDDDDVFEVFSHALRDELHKTLAKGEQAILLINRRGFSTHVTCRNCGHVFKCPTCGIALTYHKKDNMLKCHHCDYVEPMPETCPECSSKYLMKTGFGTEKIQEEVERLFPSARTLRLDSDSAKNKSKIPEVIEAFRKKEADVLIGTQMIAKGHDFPDVTLVGIVLADIGLSMPSYRSNERAFQLITQAIGRSGRKEKPGMAIIQTYLPSHYAITFAARQDYELFYRKEMEMRKLQFYPPYAYLASVTIRGKNEETVIENTIRIVDFLNDEFLDDGQILGPSTPYIPFDMGLHVRAILIKFKNPQKAHDILVKMQELFAYNSAYELLINIDPYNF